jgi:hypothetical protein
MMNERIDELFGKALDQAVPETWTTLNPTQLSKLKAKFAELIVQRTLDIVEAHTEIFQSDEARAMVEHIKHSVKTDFGIKDETKP